MISSWMKESALEKQPMNFVFRRPPDAAGDQLIPETSAGLNTLTPGEFSAVISFSVLAWQPTDMKSGKLNNLSHAIIFSYLATHFGINDDNEKMRLKDKVFYQKRQTILLLGLRDWERPAPCRERTIRAGFVAMSSHFRSLSRGLMGLRPLCSFSSSGSHAVVPKKKWGSLLLSVSIAHTPCPLTEQHKPGKNQQSYFFLQKSVNNLKFTC